MELTSNLIEKTSGKAKVSLRADLLDGQFVDVSFGVMTYDGVPQDGYVSLTPYGLIHTNEGEHKEAISKALKKVQDKIAADYNITFNEPPVMEEPEIMEEPVEEPVPDEGAEEADAGPENVSEESIDSSQVGSVEDLLGNILN